MFCCPLEDIENVIIVNIIVRSAFVYMMCVLHKNDVNSIDRTQINIETNYVDYLNHWYLFNICLYADETTLLNQDTLNLFMLFSIAINIDKNVQI